MLTLDWSALTDRGLQRAFNEDALMAEPPVFAVADGMGGHGAGDVASGLAIEAMAALAARGAIVPDDVVAAVEAANRRILAKAAEDPARAGMGTTLTGLALVESEGSQRWMVFNIGDSRVYRFADGELAQLTVDHSEVQEFVAAGKLTAEAARTYPRRNVVTRSLGTGELGPVDSWLLTPTPGERFVVCSDGLTEELDDAEIAAVVAGAAGAEEAARRLMRRAIDAGGRDNVTVVVVDVPAGAGAGD
jgi:protein phosphatase